jgi:hypothetical protein
LESDALQLRHWLSRLVDEADLFLVSQAVINSLQYEDLPMRNVVNDVMQAYGEDIFMTHTVHEALWGYVDPALKILMQIQPKWFYTDFVGYFVNVCI